MNRIFPSILLISFMLWILPLGVFIKPSLQRLACDGQRAICMCHVMVPKATDHAMEAGLWSGAEAGKEKSSSSAGNYFVSVKPVVIVNFHSASIFNQQYLAYQNPFLATIESVPKI